MTGISIRKVKTKCSLPLLRPAPFYLPVLRLVAIIGNDNKMRKNCSRSEVYILAKDNLVFDKCNVYLRLGSKEDINL